MSKPTVKKVKVEYGHWYWHLGVRTMATEPTELFRLFEGKSKRPYGGHIRPSDGGGFIEEKDAQGLAARIQEAIERKA